MNDEEFDFPEFLKKGIWHSTSVERFNSILSMGRILAEPPIPDSKRWSAAQGKSGYPFVRSIGGISIFDFRNFNVYEYSQYYSVSVWSTFVPGRYNWDKTLWLELDEDKMKNYLSPQKVMQMRKQTDPYRQIVPDIEGAYVGEIPTAWIKRVLSYCENLDEFSEYELNA